MGGNGSRWDCQSGHGKYLGKKLSFKLETCKITSLPGKCEPSGQTLTEIDAIEANWCGANGVPCKTNTFQLAKNFGAQSSDDDDEEKKDEEKKDEEKKDEEEKDGKKKCIKKNKNKLAKDFGVRA